MNKNAVSVIIGYDLISFRIIGIRLKVYFLNYFIVQVYVFVVDFREEVLEFFQDLL